MRLSDGALISTMRCAEILAMSMEDEPDELNALIGYASEAIKKYCGWGLTRETVGLILDSYGDSQIIIPWRPINAVVSLRYDTTGLFPLDTEIAPADYRYIPSRNEIRLSSAKEYGVGAFRLELDRGFTRVDYRQDEAPTLPVAGQTWLSSAGFQRYDGAAWALYDGAAMDEDLEAACAEYVHFMKIRFRAGGAGLIKKERGYSFEGSAVEYEVTMPQHIRDRLAPFTVIAI